MSRQRNHRGRETKQGIGTPKLLRGPTETAMQYENIPPHPTQDECLYKEAILPRDTCTAQTPATEVKAEKAARTGYENICVVQCSEIQRQYENVCPPSAPHSAYVNVDI